MEEEYGSSFLDGAKRSRRGGQKRRGGVAHRVRRTIATRLMKISAAIFKFARFDFKDKCFPAFSTCLRFFCVFKMAF
jgi:hypothetical protein